MEELHRRAVPGGRDRPGELGAVVDFIDLVAGRVAEGDPVAGAGELAVVGAEGLQGEEGIDGGGVLGDDGVAVGSDGRAAGEGEADAAAERPAGEVDGRAGGVEEFDEVGADRVIGGVVVDLVDDDL